MKAREFFFIHIYFIYDVDFFYKFTLNQFDKKKYNIVLSFNII